MSRDLRGGCSCGRNKYIISLPSDATNHAEVFFDDGHSHPHPQHAMNLIPYLRIPLPWYHSTTYAYFADESHRDIRKTFTHPSRNHTKRQFCGFCGDGLSVWKEVPRGESEWICVLVGTLGRDGREALESEGVVEEGQLDGGEERETQVQKGEVDSESEGESWYERLLRGAGIGGFTRRSGSRETRDGARVEWEVLEWIEDDGEGGEVRTTAKRKLDTVDTDDSIMEGLH